MTENSDTRSYRNSAIYMHDVYTYVYTNVLISFPKHNIIGQIEWFKILHDDS